MKIRWLFILKSFVSDGCNFENNALPNREPVKFSKRLEIYDDNVLQMERQSELRNFGQVGVGQ